MDDSCSDTKRLFSKFLWTVLSSPTTNDIVDNSMFLNLFTYGKNLAFVHLSVL